MANFIEADVIQKIATEAEWLTQTRIPYQGQIMIVSDSSGKVVNMKVGDGVNPFSDLNYMFDFTNSQRISAVPPGVLPTPTEANTYMVVTEVGDYTFGGNTIVSITEDGYQATLWWNGSDWVSNGTVRIKGDTGASGKTIENFNPDKPGGYQEGDSIYYPPTGDQKIYRVLANAAMGESPETHPEKFGEPVGGVDVSVFNSTKNTLELAISEINDNDKSGIKTITYTDVNGIYKTYEYAGLYYQKVAFDSVSSWIDVDNRDKFEIVYFTHIPDLRNSQKNKTINGSNVIVDSANDADFVTDFIPIERLTRISTSWLGRFITYDENKNQVAAGIIYGNKIFNPSTDKFVKVNYTNNQISIDYGSIAYPANSTTPTTEQSHVLVVENYNRVVDIKTYNPNITSWETATSLLGISPLIAVKVGDRVTAINKTTKVPYISGHNFRIFRYDSTGAFISTGIINGTSIIPAGVSDIRISLVGDINNILTTVYSLNGALVYNKPKLLKWHIAGDSISNMSDYGLKGYGWLLGQELNIKVRNRAVSGSTAAGVLTRVNECDFSDVDLFTLMIGTNDFAYNVSTATFKANLIAIVEAVRAKNIATKIGLITFIRRSGITDETLNEAGATPTQFNNAIKEVGQEQGIAVLDLRSECQLNPTIEAYKTNYTVSADGTHPTDEGHRLFIAPLIKYFVKKLIPLD